MTQVPDAYGDRIAFHPDGRRFATAEGSAVRLFDGDREVAVLDLDDAFGLSFSGDGKLLYAAPAIVEVASGTSRDLPSAVSGFAGKQRGWGLVGAVIPPDGKALLVAASLRGGGADASERLLVLDPERRTVARELWSGSDRHDTLAADAGHFAAAFKDIRLWSRRGDGEPEVLAHHGFKVTAMAFHGDRLASGDASGALAVWDAASGKLLASTKAHGGDVHAVAWSPDGKRLWTGGADGRLKVWTAELKPAGPAPPAFDGPVQAVALSPDSKRALVAVGAPNHRLLRLTLD